MLFIKSFLILFDLLDCCTPGFPVHHSLPEFAQFMFIELVLLSNHHIICPLLLPPIFPSIRVFSSESALCIRWPKYWNFSISPSNEYSVLISYKIDWFDLLRSKELSRVFFSTTIWKCQFFGSQPSLLSNSHILTWILEKP